MISTESPSANTGSTIQLGIDSLLKHRKMYSLYIIGAGGCLLILTIIFFIWHEYSKRRKRRNSTDYRSRPLPPVPSATYITPIPCRMMPSSDYITPQPRGREIAPPLPKRDFVPYENNDMMKNIKSTCTSLSLIVNGNVQQINFLHGQDQRQPPVAIGEPMAVCEMIAPTSVLPISKPKITKPVVPKTFPHPLKYPAVPVVSKTITYSNMNGADAEVFQVV